MIAKSEIQAVQEQLSEAQDAKSSARQKLAIRRVIRECEALLEKQSDAPNRFEVLGVLFRSQQQLIGIDDSATNRRAFLETCRLLAEAPNEYAAARLDADLLLSQAELAQSGADQQTRADALRPFVERYRDTEVEAEVIRIAMLMALEFGDAGLIGHLRQVIAERFPGDLDLINFQRDKLAGQVFGAPFVGRFERSDGKVVRLPMDYLGKTTGLYFWSQDNGGVEDLKALAEAWKKVKAESDAADRYQFISFNLDDLPDAGESVLRELGLDWPALRLPGGRDHPIYKTYARVDPVKLTMSTSGYTALYMSGGRAGRGHERNMQSALARVWTKPRYTSQMQSLLAGEFLVLDSTGSFDPAAPPEFKAIQPADAEGFEALKRNAASVPEDKLSAIQACFIQPPLRYRVPAEQVRVGYEQADQLCKQAIEQHPDADDLWIVRNRRIVALMGLWKLSGERSYYDAAAQESELALEKGYPAGCDVVARFCLARRALRAEDADPAEVIGTFAHAGGDASPSAPALAAAALLALDVGDRKQHEAYRRALLDDHVEHPMLWTASAFMLDRYQRYWLYHPPFTAGWTYGRRQGHFLAIGTPEDAQRTFEAELKTLDGKPVRVPGVSDGKWTVIHFVSSVEASSHAMRYGTFVKDRPFEDVNLIIAVLGEDADATRAWMAEQKKPLDLPVYLVPGGLKNPLVRQLGILAEDERPNILILRPDGSIASFLSGLTMSAQHGNVMENVIQRHDEAVIDKAISRGDLDEAKRLAFAFAPVQEPTAPGQKPSKPKAIAVPHLRARAKLYAALEDWDAAYADAQAAYLSINSRAGWLSMRTDELDQVEKLKESIAVELEEQ